MPTYEYRCSVCDRLSEIEMSINDPERRECYLCGHPMERLISRSSFQLKGDGWFKDGYDKNKKH